ncbi:hypothetical protein WJX81_003823 [Elliptochloris bilobata]|uniref:Phospholipase B-like n=1 Tax=Elliptochloris bilobata TaxID=381761 RepID=A0AAW1S317_9CHLO
MLFGIGVSCLEGPAPDGHQAAYASALRPGDKTADWRVVKGFVPGSAATAKFVDARTTASGFGQLHVRSCSGASDTDQCPLERIHDHFANTHSYFLNQLNASLTEPVAWLERQNAWARRQVSQQNTTFYQVLGLVLAQFDGLVAGYQMRHRAEPTAVPFMSRQDFIFLNGNGDLYDLTARQPQMPDPSAMSPHELYMHIALAGRCSALVTVSPDLSEILVGHSTWDSYSQIVRMFKHFQFDLTQPGLTAQQTSYSSYPGELFSDDDLYMMDSGLTVVSTTNKLFNLSLYAQLTEASLVSWQRIYNMSGLRAFRDGLAGDDFSLLSRHNPLAAVCARGDLDARNPHPQGCFDSKVTSAPLALRLEADVIAGPTTQDGIPPFRWTPAFDYVEHKGQPEEPEGHILHEAGLA